MIEFQGISYQSNLVMVILHTWFSFSWLCSIPGFRSLGYIAYFILAPLAILHTLFQFSWLCSIPGSRSLGYTAYFILVPLARLHTLFPFSCLCSIPGSRAFNADPNGMTLTNQLLTFVKILISGFLQQTPQTSRIVDV